MSFIDEIINYYYVNTIEGQRMRALNLSPSEIRLTPDFPYYSDGVRILDLILEDYNYNIYVDLSIMDSYLLSNSHINNIIFVSNDKNIENKSMIYLPNYFFEIDMSKILLLFSENSSDCRNGKTRIYLDNLNNLMECHARLKLPNEGLIILDNLYDIDKSLETLSILPHVTKFISGSRNKLNIYYEIVVLKDFQSCVDYIKFLMNKFNNLLLKSIYLTFQLQIKDMTYDEFLELEKLVSAYNESLDYPDFQFLRRYKKYFKNIKVDLVYCWW